MWVYPTSAVLQESNAADGPGNLETLATEATLTKFVFGPKRLAPVRITEFSVSVVAFDTSLNPIRAKLSLGIRVLSVDDVGFSEQCGSMFMSYLRGKQTVFFDEADALFGKRSETKDAHDRYANQEVAYLLQRIESFEGVVILASNLHRNLDEAFLRRFEAVVYFPPPRAEERLRLWREGFSPRAQVSADLERIALEHDLTGGAIINVIRKVSLAAIARVGLANGEGGSRESLISHGDIEEAIRSERGKNG